jgi:endonuclease YncB( thermonuclease family)
MRNKAPHGSAPVVVPAELLAAASATPARQARGAAPPICGHWKGWKRDPRKRFPVIQAALGALLFLAAALAPAAELRSITVVGVTDGATITVRDGKRNYKVRLAGIDAPEKGQSFANTSRQNLISLAHEKQAIVDCYKTDQYKRQVCRVWVGGKDVALAQVQAGLAWHYRRFEKEQTSAERIAFAKAEEEARASRFGLWKSDKPVPPWEFRQRGVK